MRRIQLPLPWPGVAARVGRFGIPGTESRLPLPMQRVHRSRCARALAIELLDEQGVGVPEIAKGPVGQPIWPAGFVGSLAHTDHHAVAVIAPAEHCAALGIDIEPALPLTEDAPELFLTQAERRWVESVAVTEPLAGRMIRCAKQCVHKAIHPLAGVWLDAEAVRIEIDLAAQEFACIPLSPAAHAAFAHRRAQGVFRHVEDQRLVVLALTND